MTESKNTILSWDSWWNEKGLFPDNLHPIITVNNLEPSHKVRCLDAKYKVSIRNTNKYDGDYIVNQGDIIHECNNISFIKIREIIWKGYPCLFGNVNMKLASNKDIDGCYYEDVINWSNPKFHPYLTKVYSDYNLRSRNVPFHSEGIGKPPTFP